jgi:nucleotide-binding universal stress UspA family protein
VPHPIFERILVGLDGGRLSFDGCRQAARLAEPETTIEGATVSLWPPAAATALGAANVADRVEREAGTILQAAQRILGPHAELRLLHGLTVDALLEEVERTQATLLVIGAPERPRIEEIILGGVAGELLHQAPCSTLLARPVPDETAFPASIVVGLDGSPEGDRAYDVARTLATRRHGTLRTVVALGGKQVDLDEIRRGRPDVEAAAAVPVQALVEAGTSADLLVVGSRGLHGPRALGSVSERVAHQAPCSVLVVR